MLVESEASDFAEAKDGAVLTSIPPVRPSRLYGLVVGIDAYEEQVILENRVLFPRLHGCVSDAHKVKQYLHQEAAFEPHIELLLDNDATKAGIIKHFREHLSKACAEDVVVFYFSGHGTLEKADPAWRTEIDGRLECLACYYDETSASDFLLADKELRYLIQEVSRTGAHIVTLFDCCHSGDNTRAVNVARIAFPHLQPVEKRIPFTFKQRDWSKFIFSSSISRQEIQEQGIDQLIPEGRHVQLAACEANESAVEVDGEGVFTKTLLTILQATAGGITYFDLQSRVRAYLRNVFEQKPRFRVAGGTQGMLYQAFLNRATLPDAALVGTIIYSPAGWSLNKGAIHGIGSQHRTFNAIDTHDNQLISFAVKQVFADYTSLVVGKTAINQPDTALGYQVSINGLLAQVIRVNLQLEDTNRNERVKLLEELLLHTAGQVEIVETPNAEQAPAPSLLPDYTVQGRKGRLYLTLPTGFGSGTDRIYRPLIKPVEADSPTAIATLASDLRHIARWEYIRRLANRNPVNQLSESVLQIDVHRQRADGTEELLDIASGAANLDYEAINSDEWQCPLRIRITNVSGRDLYISVLYLTMAFEATLSLLPTEVMLLEKQTHVNLSYNGHEVIPFGLHETITLYNWPERIEYLKVIASTELFDPFEMQLDELPAPPLLTSARGDQARGPGMIRSVLPALHGWTTQTLALQWKNPVYNQVDKSMIEAMLADSQLADFALGLYFENADADTGFPGIQLKSVLQVASANVPLREKGIIGDFALAAANRIARAHRNSRYNKAIRNFPDRIRIVSEGDSWFQHPLVTDTIDHLSAYYAVYCIAAAGDTLRNMTSPPEEYLTALEQIKPHVFLLSGGGNDILGEQFRQYIKPGIAAGAHPSAYLEETLNADLDALQASYCQLFEALRVRFPKLPVLVHGYDYVIPLSVTNKGWLGRYLIEKGILAQQDRRGILRYILQEFNHRMINAAALFPNVSYIATPGTVQDDQWYDEIHPNAIGFGHVAEKFKQRIDELIPHS